MDVVIISPEPGKTVEIGKRLLELAEHPHDVQWVTWPAPGGFSVPLDLFQLFDDDTIEPGHISAGEDDAAEVPKRRKRRSKTSTDNNTSEEE